MPASAGALVWLHMEANHDETNAPLSVGSTGRTVQIGICVGGLVRLWADDDAGGLWQVDDSERLQALLGRGQVARTLREDRRYREVGVFFADQATLVILARMQASAGDPSSPVATDGQTFRLTPIAEPRSEHWQARDLLDGLAQAIRGCLGSGEFLVVELGGWNAPQVPYALHLAMGKVSRIEVSPPPLNSEIWKPHIEAGAPGASMQGRIGEDTPHAAGYLMLQALSAWGVSPWDLALTFGRMSG